MRERSDLSQREWRRISKGSRRDGNGLESSDVAAPGDWTVTNLSPDRHVIRDDDGHEDAYVVKDEAFHRLYSRDHGETALW